jgi:aminopeptidase N
VAAYSSSDYGPLVYQKGPLYFHALRQVVGEAAFWEILHTYFERNRYRIATAEDWLAAVDAVTGEQHRALYEAWIEGR